MATTRVDLDEVLQELGQFGRYQLFNYLLICVPVVFSAVFVITYVFTAGEVHHRCRIPECDDPGASYYPVPDWVDAASGWETYESERIPRRCERYEPSHSNYTWRHRALFPSCPAKLFSRRLIPCKEYVFDDLEHTIVNEWGIACDNAWKLSLVGTINNVGQFVGLPLAGMFSDRMGRKTTLVLSTALSSIVGVFRSLTQDYITFIVLEFVEPLFGAGMYTSAFVICMELVGPEKRVLGGMIVCAFYALGEALLGAVAWSLRDWRLVLQVVYGPPILLIVYYWVIPESVRWLMTQGKTERARVILLKAAKMNRVTLSDQLLHDFLYGRPVTDQTNQPDQPDTGQSSQSPDPEDAPPEVQTHVPMSSALRGALSSKILLVRLANCSYCWLANTFVYYGLSLFSVAIGGNKYFNFILVSLIELPAYGVMYYLTDRFGRRATLSASLVLSGASCAAFLFIPEDEAKWVHMVPYLAGKFAITIAFSVLFIYTAELFPTSLRHSLLGVCSMFGRIGSIMAPQTPLLANYVESLPVILFGVMSLTSGMLTLFLPETVNQQLPDTVAEAERLGARKKPEES